MVKDLVDIFFENTLHVLLKLYKSEWNSFYCNVSRIINFNVSGNSAYKKHVTGSGSGFFLKVPQYAHFPGEVSVYAPHQPLCQVSGQNLVCRNSL